MLLVDDACCREELQRSDLFLAAYCVAPSHFSIRELKYPPGLGQGPQELNTPLMVDDHKPGPFLLYCHSCWIWHERGDISAHCFLVSAYRFVIP